MGKIVIKNLSVYLSDNIILDRIFETIEDGEFYVLLGESGSGKTTFLKAIAGLLFKPKGIVEVDGENIYSFNQKKMLKYHTKCGFVFQNSSLISNMSIYDNLALYFRYNTNLSEKEIERKIYEKLELVHFTDDLNQRPAASSIGEKMLVNIVRAIIHNPDYVYFDNPFANLDYVKKEIVKNIILDLKKMKKTIVLVTSDTKFALENADKIGILCQGSILESGNPDYIKNTKYSYTKNLICKE